MRATRRATSRHGSPLNVRPTLNMKTSITIQMLIAVAVVSTLRAVGAVPTGSVSELSIVGRIKGDVAQVVAGINAHDPVRATAYDAPEVISMECGRASSVGIEADRQGFKMGFAYQPYWKISLVEENVEVAASEDLAVYRGIYDEDNRKGEVQLTHKVNFIAEFRRQNDGAWKIAWYIVSEMGKSHPKK